MELKGDVFSMDAKRRILIVSFFDCTHPGKSIESSGSVFDGVLPLSLKAAMVLPSTHRWRSELRKQSPIKNKDSWEAALLPGLLCFILDTSWVKSREIAIEILFFPSSKKLSFASVRCLQCRGELYPSIISHNRNGGLAVWGGVATDKGGDAITS